MGGEFESAEDLEDFVNRFRNNKEVIEPLMGRSQFLPFSFIRERMVVKNMEGLVEGRIVHFVLDVTYPLGIESKTIICRPAIIVNAWGGKLEDGMINIQVFLDGTNDNGYMKGFEGIGGSSIVWRTSVKYSESKEIGTWHWPERN